MLPSQALRSGVPAIVGASADYVREGAALFRRAGFDGIDYSDGPDAERRIERAVRGAHDRGTFSPELADAITDWPSEYHLSRERHCLLRPLGIKPGDRVLELGCGCGALTRYLGEIGAVVTAVEGAPRRAGIAAARCRELPNVTVVVDDVLRLATAERFDWVLLIGVLEYAPVHSSEPDPVAHALRTAAAFLGPRGRLVVAIENQLGLKYFNGCGEDHVGIPFYGLQGLYGEGGPRTFGRRELIAHVRDAGLPHAAMYYPFPDYKLPRVVLSEAALCDPDFDAAGAIACVQARDYEGRVHRLFDEGLVARELGRNGLLADLSNSFLLVAAAEPLAADDALAIAFSAHRSVAFASQTRFVRDGAAIRVRKTRLHPQRDGRARFLDGAVLENVGSDAPYVRGPLAIAALAEARARRGDLGAIVTALTPWFHFLLARAAPGASMRLVDFTLPGSDLDLTPFNVVESVDGLAPIDLEWRVDRDIPLGWVVTRGAIHSLRGVAGFERDVVALTDVVKRLAARHGLPVDDDEIAAWLRRENEFQELCGGRPFPGDPGRLTSRLRVPSSDPDFERDARLAALTEAVADLEVRLAQTYRSRSWRYSYPLRLAGQILRGAPLELARTPDIAIAPPAGTPSPRRDAGRSGWIARLCAPLAPEVARYAWAALAVFAAFALTRLLAASGFPAPRMLFFIAAVAVASRIGGAGPGVFALAASVITIVTPSFSTFVQDIAMLERLGFFLVCAAIGILVSIPRRKERSARQS